MTLTKSPNLTVLEMLQVTAYHRYQIMWFAEHDVSLDDLLESVAEAFVRHPDITRSYTGLVITEWKRDMLARTGMHDFEKFCQEEFSQEHFREKLLHHEELEEYRKCTA